MVIARLIVAALVTALLASPCTASADDRAETIEAFLQEYADLGEFSGAALVADADGIVFQGAYGMAVREWDVPNDLDTRFRIGSVTKQFTAAIILMLVEDGLLSLDDKLSEALPWYRRDTGDSVTIRQLLNHTTGIDRSGVPRMIDESPCRPMPLKDEVTEYCSGDFEWRPGERFAYNNAGYLILGAVIEETTGLPYGRVFRERILEPVGMADTGALSSDMIVERFAAGYVWTDDGLARAEFVEPALASSAGGAYSTVGDLYLWDRALYTDEVLSPESRDAMFTPGQGSYGFGWWIVREPVGPGGEERTVIVHPGEGDGYHTVFWRQPEDRSVVILISNTGETGLLEIAGAVAEILGGGQPRISIASVMRSGLRGGGMERAVARYAELKAKAPDHYDFSEGELNTLGYDLLRAGRIDDAVTVFGMNAEAYPGSANALDSLAEACEAAEDVDRAIELYHRALELDPEFTHAAERLKELYGR